MIASIGWPSVFGSGTPSRLATVGVKSRMDGGETRPSLIGSNTSGYGLDNVEWGVRTTPQPGERGNAAQESVDVDAAAQKADVLPAATAATLD
jgi:hypothetical protein